LLKIKQTLIVEGTYDKIKLDSIVDTLIVTTDGFKIFSDKQKINFIRALAQKRGIIVLTDSDRAGFIIRNYIKQGISESDIKHAYIPDIFGKEKRKSTPSKEGKLGVEGIDKQVIIDALIAAGATIIGEDENNSQPQKAHPITKLDLYNDGFSGSANSAQKRRALLKHLNLPQRLSSNMLIGALNSLLSYDEYKEIVKVIIK